MLNKLKLLEEINRVSEELFCREESFDPFLRTIWSAMSKDDSFASIVATAAITKKLPTWWGTLHDVFAIKSSPDSYEVIAIDGSQIYPDRHFPISCFLINIGSVILRYGSMNEKAVVFDSHPHLFYRYELEDGVYDQSRSLVNCVRQELEFSFGIDLCKRETTSLFLIDGSLIFWHLQGEDKKLYDRFFPSYTESLDIFFQKKIPIAGYISMPKGKEIVHLLRYYTELSGQLSFVSDRLFDRLIDTTIIRSFLPPFHRTTIFEHVSSLSRCYPEMSRPCFFYIHNGIEIARVEIPFWIAEDQALVNLISIIILDQCQKGFGYPVAIAEAHEQAVVQGADRTFFYQLLEERSIARGQNNVSSSKSIRKRFMNI